MSIEQFDQVLKLLPLISSMAIGVVPITVAVVRFFKYLETIAKEKSVGITALIELRGVDKEIKDKIQELEERIEGHESELKELKNNYQKLIDKIWELLGKR